MIFVADAIFPDGQKLSDHANKISATAQKFSADVEVDKTTGVVRFVLRENGTLKGALSWDITNAKVVLESAVDMEFKVAATKKFKFTVG